MSRNTRSLLAAIAAVALALALAVAGWQLLFNGTFRDSASYFGLTCVSFCGMAVAAASAAKSYQFLPVVILGALSFYFALRGFGVIDHAWLAITAGILCWLAAIGLALFAYNDHARQE